MNILLYDFLNAYTQYDLIYYLEKMGHKCHNVKYDSDALRTDTTKFASMMAKELSEGNYDLVFTYNFWPQVSQVCHDHDIKYVSWFFDSPPNLETTKCMEYSCNRIFFFTRYDYEKSRGMGFENVFYLPLAVNTDRLGKIKVDHSKYDADVSFVGKLYEGYLPTFMACMDEYQKGYVDAVVNAQLQIYGAYIIEDVITEEFAESVRQSFKKYSEKAVQPNRMQLCWQVAAHVTHLERITLLRILSQRCDTKLYTYEFGDQLKRLLPQVKYCGSVNYIEEMPQVFRATKVNLCPILKANRTGIPLRALDIMGCGGFLLSAYQQELYEYFLDGQECVMYTSVEDAIAKAFFYLKNDDLRNAIAAAGLEKIKQDFRYEDRVERLLEV